MLSANQLSKSFGSFQALKDISFELKKGEVVGFLGPNGAGKTTTMRLLTGFLPPSKGNCTLDGENIATNPIKIRRKMGYLPESTPLYTDMEVLDYLNYMGHLREIDDLKSNLREAIGLCGLTSVLQQKIRTLSKGFKQRVGLAQALLHKPDILILDEPTVGLDPNQIVEIRRLIKDLGRDHSVLLSSHILSEVEQTCERVLIISKGEIVAQGSPQELMAQSSALPVFYLTLKAERQNLEAALKQNALIQSHEILKIEDGRIALKLTLKAGFDAGEALFAWVVAHQWVLSELRREEMSLETVFKELTVHA